MQHFIAGFAIGLIIAAGIGFVFFKKKSSLTENKNESENQITELGKLVGELAHEIKNPLSTIKVNLKLVAEELEDLTAAESTQTNLQKLARPLRKVAVITKEADRLEDILNGYLRYLDRTVPQYACVDINQLVNDMIDFYTPQAHSHSITVREGLYNQPLICKIDADMLKQALLNLFINAQQAMAGGGELIIRTERDGAKAVIQIGDTGVGIEPEKLPHIFDAYYTSRPQGSGLGLASAKKIVEQHDATISVDSEPGKGTLFKIEIPLEAGK